MIKRIAWWGRLLACAAVATAIVCMAASTNPAIDRAGAGIIIAGAAIGCAWHGVLCATQQHAPELRRAGDTEQFSIRIDWPEGVEVPPFHRCRHYLRTREDFERATRHCNEFHRTRDEADACSGYPF